jgi:hypothetical protein
MSEKRSFTSEFKLEPFLKYTYYHQSNVAGATQMNVIGSAHR